MAALKFELGRCVITANAQAILHPDDIPIAVVRHTQGDWGDLCIEDKCQNESALLHGGRIFSSYHDRNRQKFYIITEWNRLVTTVLLPEDY